MKKIIRNIGICLFGILLFAACFDDDGNYDYLVDENPIKFGYTYQGRADYPGWGDVTIYPGDSVIFEPSILNDTVCDVSRYRWEYYFDGYGLVDTQMVFRHVFPEMKTAGTYYGVVRALNRDNGLSYTATLLIKVTNKWDKGWLVLADDNNASKLNLVKKKDTVWLHDADLTQIINQEALGSGPKKLIFNTNSRTEVRVLQNSGNVILQNIIYNQLNTFEGEFNNGYPSNFVPKNFTSAGNVAAIQGEDGRVYVRTFKNNTVYAADKWLDNAPLKFEKRTMNIQYLLGTPYNTAAIKNPLMYDATTCRFYLLMGNGFNANTGGVFPIITDVEWPGVPTPEDLSEYDVVYCQMVGKSSGTTNKVFAILKKKADNSYYYYNFEVNTNNLAMLYAKKITCVPVPESVVGLIGGNAKFMVPPTTTSATKNHLFIVPASEPNKLYVTNMAMNDLATLDLYKSFDANITAMNFEPAGSLQAVTFGLGLENGKFYILNAGLDVLDDLNNMTDEEKVVCLTPMSGKIVDLFYKDK